MAYVYLRDRGVATAISAVSIIRGPRATRPPNVRKKLNLKSMSVTIDFSQSPGQTAHTSRPKPE